jgi:hypothetical protein
MRLKDLRSATASRLPLFGRWPISARLVRPSLVTPVTAVPSERLLDTAIEAIALARSVNVELLTARRRAAAKRPLATPVADGSSEGRETSERAAGSGGLLRAPALLRHRHHSLPRDLQVWPGEHYKLLTALIQLLRPKTVVEIGTATGMSALAMKMALPQDAKIVTFDVFTWQQYPRAVLQAEDFLDGRLEQRSDDLSTPAGWQRNAELLRRAEFILLDAKHDGVQERNFLRGFDEVGLDSHPIVMFDDIRLWEMLAVWQEIDRPKLDLTSFGHWSGTGLVDYA